MFSIEDRSVLWEGKLIFTAPSEIQSFFPYEEECIIIHYNLEFKERESISPEDVYRNILSVTFNGDILWRTKTIEKRSTPPYFRPKYYMLQRDELGDFWAYDGEYRHKIDPKDGNVIEYVFTK